MYMGVWNNRTGSSSWLLTHLGVVILTENLSLRVLFTNHEDRPRGWSFHDLQHSGRPDLSFLPLHVWRSGSQRIDTGTLSDVTVLEENRSLNPTRLCSPIGIRTPGDVVHLLCHSVSVVRLRSEDSDRPPHRKPSSIVWRHYESIRHTTTVISKRNLPITLGFGPRFDRIHNEVHLFSFR